MYFKIIRNLLICFGFILLTSCNWLEGPDRWLMNNPDSQPTEIEKQIILIETPVVTSTTIPLLATQTATSITPTIFPTKQKQQTQ